MIFRGPHHKHVHLFVMGRASNSEYFKSSYLLDFVYEEIERDRDRIMTHQGVYRLPLSLDDVKKEALPKDCAQTITINL